MSKPTDIQLKSVRSSTQKINYRTPIKFGGRVVNDVVLLNITVDVETRDGRTAQGFGSMPVGNAWGWPSQQVDTADTLAAMTAMGEKVAQAADAYEEMAHPLEIMHDISQSYAEIAQSANAACGVNETMPQLAQLVSASPIDAAVHDAYGKALGENSYNLLGSDFVNRDLSHYLDDDFAGETLDTYTLREPKATMPLYHLIGALDALTDGDLPNRLDDGLPETLGEWILHDELTHMKIKLNGDDLQWDVDRVIAIENAAAAAQQQRGCTEWHYSLDFNEKCANVEYVLDFLAKLQEGSPAALSRAQYIEQPTHRDLKANPENRMHEAAKIKPVVIDESLVDYESLLLAQELGYSGVALKTCKGHGEALMMGAAAQKRNLFLCVQDLTCIGFSFLHSASLAARIPGIAAIEGNGRQYCPAGNAAWETPYPGMFKLQNGTVATGILTEAGLGFSNLD